MALIIDLDNDKTFYDSVRRLLGGVDEEVLPNEDISDPVILDMAEIQVLDLVPNYDTLEDAAKAKVRLATLYFMAALLCPTMANRVEIEVKTIDTTWKKKAVDYMELAEALKAKGDSLLSLELGGDSVVFAIAPSKRAVHEKYEH